MEGKKNWQPESTAWYYFGSKTRQRKGNPRHAVSQPQSCTACCPAPNSVCVCVVSSVSPIAEIASRKLKMVDILCLVPQAQRPCTARVPPREETTLSPLSLGEFPFCPFPFGSPFAGLADVAESAHSPRTRLSLSLSPQPSKADLRSRFLVHHSFPRSSLSFSPLSDNSPRCSVHGSLRFDTTNQPPCET